MSLGEVFAAEGHIAEHYWIESLRRSPRIGDPGTCPTAGDASEHLGELAFGERTASSHTEPVRSHSCVITGVGFENPVTMLPAGRGGRLPTLSGLIAVVPAMPLAVNCCG